MPKGKLLNKNSTIGIISPASPSPKILIDKFISDFRNLGFKIKLGNCLYEENNYLTGSDKDRAKEIMDMFEDQSIDGIVSFRGGFGSIRTLPYLDINKIKRNPKFFCGFSDLTVLLNYFSNNGLITFHGPMIKSNFNEIITKTYFERILTSPSKGLIYDILGYNECNRCFSGYIKGGNLAMICSTLGTPYEPNFDNSILILEEINEPPYCIDRLLTQLILSNKLNKCNGIILGHFTDCIDEKIDSNSLINMIKKRLSSLNIPIVSALPFGHDYPNVTIPIGAYAHYDNKSNKLVICENVLR